MNHYIGLALAFLLGALIGLRYEVSVIKKGVKPLGGFRSFGFLGLLGYITGILATSPGLGLLSPVLVGLLSAFVIGIILIYYKFELYRNQLIENAEHAVEHTKSTSRSVQRQLQQQLKDILNLGKRFGIVTELAAVFVYLAGFLLATQIFPQHVVIMVVVFVAFLLAYQGNIRAALFKLNDTQVKQLALGAVLTLVVLPILPNQYFSLAALFKISPQVFSVLPPWLATLLSIELINPFKFWLYVVLIVGIETVTYFVASFLKNYTGLAISAIVSGLVSSTSATIALAAKAKESLNKNAYLGAILLANAVSFVDVFLILGAISPAFLGKVLKATLVLMGVLGITGLWFILRSNKEPNIDTDTKNTNAQVGRANGDNSLASFREKIFDLGFALKFGAFLAFVQIVTKLSFAFAGHAGLVFTSGLAGLGGINAVLISTSELVSLQAISLNTAALIFFVVNVTNLVAKGVYIFLNKEYKIGVKYMLVVIPTLFLVAVALLC